MNRQVDKRFIAAMEEKLESGRTNGRHGWDQHWEGTVWQTNTPVQCLLDALNHEVLELAVAIHSGTRNDVKYETADIANFAMMIADYSGAWEETK